MLLHILQARTIEGAFLSNANIFADLVQFLGILDILRTVKKYLTVELFGNSE